MRKFFAKIKLWLKKRELNRVVCSAKKHAAATGKKMMIVRADDNSFTAITKQDFKDVWRKKPSMKNRTVQQWQKESDKWFQCYQDLQPKNKFIHSF